MTCNLGCVIIWKGGSTNKKGTYLKLHILYGYYKKAYWL